MATPLPVFRIRRDAPSPFFINALATRLGFTDADRKRFRDYDVFRSGKRRLDINGSTGEVWFADESELWKPSFVEPRALRPVAHASAEADRDDLMRSDLELPGFLLVPRVRGPLHSVASRVFLENGAVDNRIDIEL